VLAVTDQYAMYMTNIAKCMVI